MRKRLILTSLLMGVIATLLCTRIDHALELVGRGRASVSEISADAESMMVRRRGISSVEISFSQVGSAPASPSAVLKRASGAIWSTDSLAAMGAANWDGPVQHQLLFWQGWHSRHSAPPLRSRAASKVETRMFDGLISRWMMPLVWACWTAWHTCANTSS